MALLSAAELAELRAEQADALPDTATITTYTNVDDGLGGFTTTTGTASVACRVAPSGTQPDERVIAARLGTEGLWTLTFPYGTAITASSQITVNSVTYEVVAPLTPRTWETAVRVICKRVT